MESEYQVLSQVIHQRKTDKVLGDPANAVAYTPEQLAEGDALVKQAIRDSGMAPFHYDRKISGMAEPWRVYWLDYASCRRMAKALPNVTPDLKPNNKMPGLLAGCGSLALYTWLPQSPEAAADSKQFARVNREHLAASAAAVQNLLLLLTSAGYRNYWASGTLIADHLFDHLGISGDEVLMAAVFVHYPEGQGDFQILAGKHRENRSTTFDWLSEIEFKQA